MYRYVVIGVLRVGVMRILHPHNLRMLLQLSEHLLMQKLYTCAAQPTGKLLRRVTYVQLMAAQYAELLQGNNTIIGHRSVVRCLGHRGNGSKKLMFF